MTRDELTKSQNFLLEIIQSDPNISTGYFLEVESINVFTQKTIHRIQAYRTSYYARITNVFSETIFQLASNLFGSEIINNFLIEYFQKNPSPLDMIESVREFANFLDRQAEIKECPVIPDFIRVCIGINDILSAKNPDENTLLKHTLNQLNPSEIYLQNEHLLINSAWPIYQMFCAAKELNSLIEIDKKPEEEIEQERINKLLSIKNKSECILFIKSTPWTLESILVPNEFIPIAMQLNKNLSLEEAINNAVIDEEIFDNQKFSNWIALLTKQKAFIKHRI